MQRATGRCRGRSLGELGRGAAVRTLSYPLHTRCTPWGRSAPSVRWAAGRGHFVRLSAQVNVENLTQVSVNNVAEASRLIARGNQQRMVRPRAAYTARRRCCGRLARALGTSLRSVRLFLCLQFRATLHNERSNRSHTILQLRIERPARPSGRPSPAVPPPVPFGPVALPLKPSGAPPHPARPSA